MPPSPSILSTEYFPSNTVPVSDAACVTLAPPRTPGLRLSECICVRNATDGAVVGPMMAHTAPGAPVVAPARAWLHNSCLHGRADRESRRRAAHGARRASGAARRPGALQYAADSGEVLRPAV